MFHNLFLVGFRATGKSTIGKILAKKLNWDFVDVDILIEQKTKMSINQLTKNGTEWQKFRQLEFDIIAQLLSKKNIVIAAGGGAAVNNIIKNGTNKTFGKLTTEFLKKQKNTCVVLFIAEEKVIAERIRQDEMEKAETKRPFFDKKKSIEIQKKLQEFADSPQKQKEILVEEIVKDSLSVFETRKSLYKKLTDKILDTGKYEVEECAKIVEKYLGRPLEK